MVSPAEIVLTAWLGVSHGAANEPAAESLPEVETKNIFPDRTVNATPLLAPALVVRMMLPVAAADPSWMTTLSHSVCEIPPQQFAHQLLYCAGAPPPIVTVDEPRLEP